MVVRTYFDKNNTLVSGQTVNTGKNRIAELFYGDPSNYNISRFIFQFDVERLINFRASGLFPDLTKLKHVLRLTNTGVFDMTNQGHTTFFNGKARSSSFDLVVFPLTQEWDEGVGNDYFKKSSLQGDTENVSTSPSNWYEAKTNTPWVDGNGAFSGPTNVIATQHFDNGTENIEIDITTIVNTYLTGSPNYGLGIAFSYDLENTTREESQYVGFFTRHSQTFYEPHVETTYDDRIADDRYNFFLGKDNKLYLYSRAGGKPMDLDSLPNVDVYNDDGVIVFSGEAKKNSKGIYYIELNLPSDGSDDCTMYTDVWKDIIVNGVARPNVEMDFSVKSDGYFTLGIDNLEPKNMMFGVLGLKHGEKVIRGDVRKVIVETKIPYTSSQMYSAEDVQYRLYVKEGANQFTVIDYQRLDSALNMNFFLLDTLSLLPNTYYLDVKHVDGYEVKILPELLKFEIVSQSDYRKSQ